MLIATLGLRAHPRLPGPGVNCSLGPANGTGVRPGPIPGSPLPGLTLGTQLPQSARQQWRSRNLLRFHPEKANGMVGYRTLNLMALS